MVFRQRTETSWIHRNMYIMNSYGHEWLAEWVFDFIEICNGDSLLDIGCGGGGNISRLLQKYPHSSVYGVDYSPTSVALSKKINVKEIKNNRCRVILGDAQNIPFESNSLNVVTAFETIYYWQDIEKCFREVFRILQQNGKFVIVNGADAEGGWKWDKYIDGMHTYLPFELEILLRKTGFKRIKIFRKKEWHFLCVVACKN